MITITKTSKTIEASGHADTLICNSVSVLFQHTDHALERFSNDFSSIPGGEGEGFYRIEIEHNEKNDLLFRSLASSLEVLERQFPKEVKIIEET